VKLRNPRIRIGDLVKMKRRLFWVAKTDRGMTYTEQPCLVLETYPNAVKVLYSDGLVKCDMAEHFEVINECG
jgi:hypothetical protein